MSSVAAQVLSIVNAPPYGTRLSAEQLAAKLCDPSSAPSFDPSAFAFFSEVDVNLQIQFLDEMHLDPTIALDLVQKFSALAGYPLPLARSGSRRQIMAELQMIKPRCG